MHNMSFELPGSPPFKNTITMLQGNGPSSIPTDWDFGICQGTAKIGPPCQNFRGDPKEIKQLCNKLMLEKQSFATKEFFDQLHVFVSVSHCEYHAGISREIVEEWKNHCMTDVIKSVNEARGIADHNSSDGRTSIKDDSTTEINVSGPNSPTQLGVTAESNHNGNLHVDAIAECISTIDLASTNQTSPNSRNSPVGDKSPEYIFSLGLASLKRSQSLRNDAPFFSEIYKPLTKSQTMNGIVYILELKGQKEMFKIGWTTKTIETLKHSCNNKQITNTIYKTPGGPFFAAAKAKKLALIALSQNSADILKCDHCDGKHRDWVNAKRERVIDTVKSMETFVQLPAYKSTDGKDWQLSPTAGELVGRMCRLSLSELERPMTPTKTCPIDDTSVSPMTPQKQETDVFVDEINTPQSSRDSFEMGNDKSSSVPTEELDTGKSKHRSLRSVKDSAKKRGEKIFRKAEEMYNHRRQSPEANMRTGDSEKTNNRGPGSGYGDQNKEVSAVLDIFWSIFPENITTEKGDVYNKGARPSTSWFKRKFRKVFRLFWTQRHNGEQ